MVGSDHRVVIVGAGLTGANVAVSLRDEGFRGSVTLIGAEPGLPFGRPPLSRTYLRSEEDLGGWYVKPSEWYAANDVQRVTETSVQRVDCTAQEVLLTDGRRLAYDRLAYCAGGRPRRPAVPGADLPGVHVLRTVADSDAIKRAARPGARAVVVGMSFIGSEVAASLRQLGLQVTTVLPDATPLERALGRQVGDVMAGIHRERGVELVTSDRVAGFEGGETVERVVTGRGARIDCDLVVIGAGIALNLEALRDTPVTVGDGVIVDDRCRSSVAGIHAAGDCASHNHPLFGRVRVEHYNNAEKMGRYLGRAMLGDDRPYDYLHTFWSDQYEHTIEYVGHASRWDEFVVRGSLEERRFIGFYVQGGVVRAAIGLDRGGDPELDEDGELHACAQLVAAQAALPSPMLADEAVDLRSLPVSH